MMPATFTLGVVPYLNALPLYRTAETGGAAKIVRAVPSRLAAFLDSGECDAALLPIVDHLRGAGTGLVSNACIGNKFAGSGAMRSVLLFTRAPLSQISQIQSVAVDTNSHTSVALLRIILADAYKALPPFVEHAPDLNAMPRAHDAALLIGD